MLLRDIFRLGTATSALLSVFYSVFEIKFCERTPAGVHSVAVPVVGPGFCQLGAAFHAQPSAVFTTQGRQRQREHHRVTERGLQVEEVAVEESILAIVL